MGEPEPTRASIGHGGTTQGHAQRTTGKSAGRAKRDGKVRKQRGQRQYKGQSPEEPRPVTALVIRRGCRSDPWVARAVHLAVRPAGVVQGSTGVRHAVSAVVALPSPSVLPRYPHASLPPYS
jgi:hypothetical protein